MYKSYFFLLRATQELNSLLSTKNILEIYTQERDKLFLHIPLEEMPYYHFIINTNPQEFHLYFKEEHRKAKRNTIGFFSEFLPRKIIRTRIALGERIIAFDMESGKFYILFRGNKSNCFFSDSENSLQSFKKISDDQLNKLKEEFSTIEWIDTSEPIFNKVSSIQSMDEFKTLPYVSKEIIKIADSKNDPIEAGINIIEEIIHGKIAVGIDNQSGEAIFRPYSILDSTQDLSIELFDNYFDAVANYFSIRRTVVKTQDSKSSIEKYLDNEIEKTTSKLNKLKARIETGSRETEYHRIGEILLASLGTIKKGMSEIVLNNWETTTDIKIKIDPKLAPQQNVNKYFDKARSEKIEFEKSSELYRINREKFDKLISIREAISRELTQEQINAIKKELKMNQQQNSTEEKKDKLPFRHFLIEGKYHFYIGKDSKNNDMLTTKFAKQNDFWFHARSVAGSHGVLRVENSKEAVPKRVLEKAASIAAFYSKSKTSKMAPVTYTLKKYVTKNSRHEVGQVSVMKESVLLVRPEIPTDCEYIED